MGKGHARAAPGGTSQVDGPGEGEDSGSYPAVVVRVVWHKGGEEEHKDAKVPELQKNDPRGEARGSHPRRPSGV